MTLPRLKKARQCRRLPLIVLVLGFWAILKNLCLIPSDDSKQVWFSLKTFDDLLTLLHTKVLLIIIQQSWHQFWADFPHALIFIDNLSNIFFFSYLADFQSFEQSTNTHYTLPPYLFNVYISPACWRFPTLGVIFLPPHTSLWTSCDLLWTLYEKKCHGCQKFWLYLYIPKISC